MGIRNSLEFLDSHIKIDDVCFKYFSMLHCILNCNKTPTPEGRQKHKKDKLYKKLFIILSMLKTKEISIIILVSVILAFALSLTSGLNLTVFLYLLLSLFLIIILNVSAKKVAAYYLESEIDVRLWEIERYGFKPRQYFKRPIPAGVFFPLILIILSFGYVKWLACLVFEVKPKIYRAAKRHGLYSFTEITEYHMALIASAGIIVNLVFAIVGYLIGLPKEMDFSRLSIYYAFFNMLPLSDLDGNKIFFGSLVLWSFLATLVLIGVFYSIFLV